MQKLARSVAEMSDQMSIEQMRLYKEFVEKSLEARVAEEAFFAAADDEASSDSRVADTLRDIRRILEDQTYRLSGSESVLLASMSKLLEEDEYLDTKRLNILLHSYDRKPSNTTKIVDTLDKKSLMEIRSDGLHSHKTFRLSRQGEEHTRDLLAQLNRSTSGDRLAVVD